MTDVVIQQPTHHTGSAPTGVVTDRDLQQMELAAFEKGRMQGEMEAIRRVENEQALHPNKQMGMTGGNQMANAATMQTPDVVEINRLTWLQRAAWALGEASKITYLVLLIVWYEVYRGSFGWGYGDGVRGETWNTAILCLSLGVFFHAQAISNYRVLPLNMSANANRVWYLLMQCAAATCFGIALAGLIISQPGTDFWSVGEWCFALALAVWLGHFLYSVYRIMTSRVRPVHHENWAEVPNKLESTPEQRRDHSGFNTAGRSIYTPAPHALSRAGRHMPAANQNVGAEVPVAPGNAPRWAENPNTHAENYFLLPRAKWANVAYWSLGASLLMLLAGQQRILPLGTSHFSNDTRWGAGDFGGNGVQSTEVTLIGVAGLTLLLSLICISYASMPPRTTVVKNGILNDANRRSSISHNAETRVGHTGGHHTGGHHMV